MRKGSGRAYDNNNKAKHMLSRKHSISEIVFPCLFDIYSHGFWLPL
jgi:hypothetical protein